MRVYVELLLLFLSIYQSYGLLNSRFYIHKHFVHPLYNTIVPGDQLPEGFEIDSRLTNRPGKPKQPLVVSSISHLKELIYQGYRVEDLDVRGDTSRNVTDIHPVVKALYARRDQDVSLSYLYISYIVFIF